MKKCELKQGNDNCPHKWVRRDKKNISVLYRVCPDCGKEELHSEEENLTEQDCKKIMRLI